jgi:phage-related protein
MREKPICWVGSALDDLKRFPDEVRRQAGYQLARVQAGLMPDDWKPMSTIGPGVCELRIRTMTAHRVIYSARFGEAVYVLHAFEKRTRRTRQVDLDLARTRLRAIVSRRRDRAEKP